MSGYESASEKRVITIEAFDAVVESYRVGARWGARVETTDESGPIGRGSGETRQAAEEAAIESARAVLEMRSAASAFRTSTNRLRP